MGSVEKVAMAIVGVAMVTTLILPGRQTPKVVNAFTGLFTKSLGTSIGTYKPK
jgi:hypothetical protein